MISIRIQIKSDIIDFTKAWIWFWAFRLYFLWIVYIQSGIHRQDQEKLEELFLITFLLLVCPLFTVKRKARKPQTFQLIHSLYQHCERQPIFFFVCLLFFRKILFIYESSERDLGFVSISIILPKFFCSPFFYVWFTFHIFTVHRESLLFLHEICG